MNIFDFARRFCVVAACSVVIFFSLDTRAACLTPAGDVTGDNAATVVDVQCTILSALYDLGGQAGPVPSCIFEGDISRPDLNCDGEVTVVDVQITISMVLGMNLDPTLDTNANKCVDACEALCPGLPNGSSYYHFCPAATWTEAQATCTLLGGNLVTINNAAENAFIDAQTGDGSKGSYWIGYNDLTTEGTFGWASGETSGYTDFCSGEPNNFNGNQDCVRTNWLCFDGTYRWDDAECAATIPFVCEIVCDDGNPCTTDYAKANGTCGVTTPEDDCCLAHAGAGCAVSSCQACVCALDGFCCDVEWDGLCAGEAANDCAAQCNCQPKTCSDNNACTTGDTCTGAACTSTPLVCNDNNACTADSCNPQTGCVFTALVCDDNNSCTTNGCNPQSGCTFTPVPTENCMTIFGIEICIPLPAIACDDNNACTLNTACTKAGACAGGASLSCNDNNICTVDGCDPVAGCTTSNITSDCCSSKGTPGCANSACQNCVCGLDAFCCNVSWDNICAGRANNECGASCACSSLGCNDNNLCTSGDTCGGGSCTGSAVDCNDGLACTLDGCNPASGCTHLSLSADCCSTKSNPGCGNPVCQGCVCPSDGFCCVVSWDGLCAGAAQNQCAGSCGCAADSCDDGDGCTSGDVCQVGSCQGTPVSCNDDNPCTADSCDYTCDEGTFSGSSCYMVVNDQTANFATAEAECQAWGGHLVAIESAAENAFVANQVGIMCPTGSQTGLIGLNDTITEGQYVWTNGDPLTFSAWGIGEPNNAGNEDAAHIYPTGLWNDIGTANLFNCFVCEKAAESFCKNTPVASGTPCPDDGDACTTNACNNSGGCSATAVVCDDNNQCTTDSCNPAGGCNGYLNGSSCYRIESPEPGLTWQTAEAECQAWGGHLVSVNSAAENAFVHTVADTECPAPYSHVFIGMNDITTEGVYTWIAGDTVSYTNWAVDEPNNSGNEDVSEMLLITGQWNDVPTSIIRSCLICEKPLNAAVGCVHTPSDCSGGCCIDNGSPGCDDKECTECVCKVDPYCCALAWDDLCAQCAEGTGGAPACLDLGGCEKECPQCDTCGNGFCGPNEDCISCQDDCGFCTGSCCTPDNTKGCDNLGCQNCVCTIDPFCCNVTWDGLCADCASGNLDSACDACTIQQCLPCDTCGNGICKPGDDCCDCAADCPGTCFLGILCI